LELFFAYNPAKLPECKESNESAKYNKTSAKEVVEVQFDHFTGGRYRHGTKFLRWRPYKAPRACTLTQIGRENRSALNLL
jgi:ATP-dependent DNA ligase